MPAVSVGTKVTAALLAALQQAVQVQVTVAIASGVNTANSPSIPFGVTFAAIPAVQLSLTVNRKYGMSIVSISTTAITIRVFTSDSTNTGAADNIGVQITAYGSF